MRDIRRTARAVALSIALPALAVRAQGDDYVRRDGTHLMLGRQRFYYMGANCFYLAYFAQDQNIATNNTTWRQMSDEVLARSRELGLRVLRIWAFNEQNKQEFSAWHGDWRFQTSPGVYREQALVGLDYVLDAAAGLGIRLVLTLVNNWNDYGGMLWYVQHSPTASTHDDFYTDAWCRTWYKSHFATLAGRTNTFNGRVYRDDPAILAWQLANEPRSADIAALTNWVYEMGAYIKSIDTNHMVCTGEEGWEPEWSLNAACPHIDYAVIHCWPDWWWPGADGAVKYAYSMSWVTDRLAAAQSMGKPLVLSEYGRLHPDWGGPPLDDPYGRNSFYRGWFDAIYGSAAGDGPAAGLHFWMLEADDSGHDDMVGSVFASHVSTIELIRNQAGAMNALIAPSISSVSFGPEGARLSWTEVVGNPRYRIDAATELGSWQALSAVSTNTWTDPGYASATSRFYRIVPEYAP